MASLGGTASRDFLAWWGEELRGLVPLSRRDAPLPRTRHIVTPERDGTVMVSGDRGGAREARGDGPGGLDALPRGAAVTLRVPFDACFVRRSTIPAAARRDAARLAALDLERATPFRPADILTGIIVGEGDGSAADRLAVTQFVLKRDRVAAVLAELELRGHPVAAVGCWAPDRSGPMPVLLAPADAREASRPASARAVLVRSAWAGAAAASVAALAIALVKHENALATVTLDATSAREAAAAAVQRQQRAAAASARSGAIIALRAGRPYAAEILDEITRLVPDDAHLTELAMEGGEIEISGLAASPARLVEAFERSRLFVDARFSAPSRFDPREERERFSLRVRLRGAPSAGRAGGAP